MRMNSEERKRRKRRRVGLRGRGAGTEARGRKGGNQEEKKERWGGRERVLRGV